MSNKEIEEMKAVYEETFYRRNFWDAETNGVDRMYPNGPIAQDLIPIEELALLAKGDLSAPFKPGRDENFVDFVEASPLGKCLERINWKVREYTNDHGLSPYVDEFFRLYWSDLRRGIVFPPLHAFDDRRGRFLDPRMADFYKGFVNEFRRRIDEKDVRKRANTRRSRSTALYEESCRYVDSLFKKEPDLAVISIDICIGAGTDWPDDQPSLRRWKFYTSFVSDFLRRDTSPMSKMVGYMGRWDWTESKGWHMHMALFMEGKKIPDDEAFAREIGRYWVEDITKGEGAYHLPKSHRELKALGSVVHINKSDREKRSILRDRLVSYLSKSDIYYQHASLEMPVKFIRGQLPEGKSRKKRESKVAQKPAKATGKASSNKALVVEVRKTKSYTKVRGKGGATDAQ